VLGADGTRLAKRHGPVTLADLAAAGQTPADARARLAVSAGLAQPGERLEAADLLERFDPDLIPTGPSVLTA
jgi:glutamyl-tRNA synthetase